MRKLPNARRMRTYLKLLFDFVHTLFALRMNVRPCDVQVFYQFYRNALMQRLIWLKFKKNLSRVILTGLESVNKVKSRGLLLLPEKTKTRLFFKVRWENFE